VIEDISQGLALGPSESEALMPAIVQVLHSRWNELHCALFLSLESNRREEYQAGMGCKTEVARRDHLSCLLVRLHFAPI
jgi:hypothetical protein